MDAILGMITDETEGVTAAEYFIVALASPLLQSFANDDGVDDNKGTITGYGVNDQMANMGNNFIDGALNVADFLYSMLRYLVKIFNIWMN
jgi:hypothetical protein